MGSEPQAGMWCQLQCSQRLKACMDICIKPAGVVLEGFVCPSALGAPLRQELMLTNGYETIQGKSIGKGLPQVRGHGSQMGQYLGEPIRWG